MILKLLKNFREYIKDLKIPKGRIIVVSIKNIKSGENPN